MDIAIVGISGRFPEAENLSAFYNNLATGRDSIRELSKERMLHTSVPVSDRYQVMAYLDNIDLFDYAFFRLSLGEARNMDPHQRLALELVYEAFENAGYDPFSFAGSETAVYMADNALEYYQLAKEFDPTLLTGNLNAVVAGRISRFFDLRGEAMMIDTSCSSSLVAVHHACLGLESGDIDQAIVCGIKIRLFPGYKVNEFNVGIGSVDGRTRSYSAGANGTGTGEAGGCILLKPLQKAISDRNIIHAVIKGSAVNQDAALSGSLTAPSSTAQARVIKKAWAKAAIDPCTITFIEGHGTATKLGDPIEIGGIDLAFSAFTSRKNFCALSSLKSNIGHTDTAAGIAGLIKTLLSIRYKKLFPSVHFDKPNPFIDFDNSHLFVNTSFRDWETGEGTVRRAGVSSFGLSGTNCHVVLEEAPLYTKSDRTLPKQVYPIPISGFTRASLLSNIERLKNWLTNIPEYIPDPAIQSLSYTLCVGRPHFSFRHIVLSDSVSSLPERLDAIPADGHNARSKEKLYFIFSHNDLIDASLIDHMCHSYPEFAAKVNSCREIIREMDAVENNAFRIFSFQYAFFNVLKEKKIFTRYLLGEGVGEITIAAVTGEITLHQAAGRAVTYQGDLTADLTGKCEQFIRDNKDDGLLMMELGPVNRITKAFHSLRHEKNIDVAGIDAGDQDILLGVLSRLYIANYPVDWIPFFAEEDKTRIELPAYAFDRKRCWIREIENVALIEDIFPEKRNIVSDEIPVLAGQGYYDLQSIKDTIRQVWKEVLKNDDIRDEDDYFEIGGHSLNGTQVLNRLNKILNLALEMDDLFDHGSIADLSGHIFSLLNKDRPATAYDGIKAAAPEEYYPLTHTQQRFWVMDQIEKELTAYNMPAAYMIHGELNITAFTDAFDRLVLRHESLRTTFVMIAGEPRQKIGDGQNFKVEYIDLRDVKGNKEIAMLKVKQQAAEPFDLAGGPLIKASLYRLEDNTCLFFYSVHHIIADGWSMEVLVRDVLSLYENACHPAVDPPKPLKIQYRDYVVWLEKQLSGESLSGHKQYWLAEFGDLPPSLLLTTDFTRPARQTFNGDKIHLVLDEQIRIGLKDLSNENACTPFMTLLACINVLLCKKTRQYDMVIGTPVSGRMHAELEDLIGLFLNTLPIRLKRSEDETFSGILQAVKAKVLQATQHQLYPFDCLLHDLSYERDQGRNSLFDVGFTYNTLNSVNIWDENDQQDKSLMVEPVTHGFRSVKADWWFHLTDTHDKLLITLDYNTDLFLPATASRLLDDFEWLIARLIASPDTTLRQLIEDMEYKEEDQKLKSQSGLKKKNLELLRSISRQEDQNPTDVLNN